MAEMKPGWQRVKFGDVVRQVKDKVDPHTSGLDRYVAGEHMDTDDLNIRRWGNIGEGYLGPAFHMHFKPGHVLYGSRRTYLRKVAVADFEGICANTTFVLESADSSKLLPELLPFVMQTEAFHEHSKRESKGSVNPYVNFSDLAWYEFGLPPLEDQARLVEALSAFRTYQEKFNEVIRASKMLREAAFASSISGEAIAREEIGRLANFGSGKLIRVSDLPKCRSEWNRFPVVGGNGIAGFSDQPLARVPTPCIAIGRVGEYCGAVHFIDEPCWVTDNALYVKSHTERLRSRYLERCLQSLHLNRHATGGAQPLMTHGIINGLRIPVPDLEQQDKIISADMAVMSNTDAILQRFVVVRKLGRRLLVECFEE